MGNVRLRPGTAGAGGGGGATPSLTNVFQASLSSGTQNTNGVSTDYTWNSSVKNGTYVTHSDGNAEIQLAAGMYYVYAELVVTDGQANNRQTFRSQLVRNTSGDALVYAYPGSGAYIRDDASTYDSGCSVVNVPLVVDEDDKIIVRSVRLDAQTAAGNNYANQTSSRIRIDAVEFS